MTELTLGTATSPAASTELHGPRRLFHLFQTPWAKGSGRSARGGIKDWPGFVCPISCVRSWSKEFLCRACGGVSD